MKGDVLPQFRMHAAVEQLEGGFVRGFCKPGVIQERAPHRSDGLQHVSDVGVDVAFGVGEASPVNEARKAGQPGVFGEFEYLALAHGKVQVAIGERHVDRHSQLPRCFLLMIRTWKERAVSEAFREAHGRTICSATSCRMPK